MACALTQGYILDCKDNAGGAKAIWLANFANVSGVTAASGTISAIAKANNGRFYKYEQIRGTAEAKEEIQGSSENGTVFYNQSIELALNKMQASLRNEIKLMATAYLVAVVQDRNDNYWYYGETNGLELLAGTIGTGKALGDRNGYGLTLSGQEPVPAQQVASGVIATLITP